MHKWMGKYGTNKEIGFLIAHLLKKEKNERFEIGLIGTNFKIIYITVGWKKIRTS